MSAACVTVRAWLPAYGLEALAPAQRNAVRDHLADCGACRRDALDADPTLLFAGLPAEAVSDEEVGSVVAAVRAGVALRQAERRIGRPRGAGLPPRTRRLAVRSAAAAAIVLLTLALPSGPRPEAASKRAGARVFSPAAGLSAVAVPADAVKAAGGATVYDWNPGAGEPRVVWIVDGSLDI